MCLPQKQQPAAAKAEEAAATASPPPPVAPPPVLTQQAPRQSSADDSEIIAKRKGLGKYMIGNGTANTSRGQTVQNMAALFRSSSLGGIPNKTGIN